MIKVMCKRVESRWLYQKHYPEYFKIENRKLAGRVFWEGVLQEPSKEGVT